MGQAEANMGVAFGDVDGDGLFDLFVTHLTAERHTPLEAGPAGLFRDRTAASGLAQRPLARHRLRHRAGRLRPRRRPGPGRRQRRCRTGRQHGAAASPFWEPYAERNQLFANDGQGEFRDISPANPAFCGSAGVSRGLAVGDVDGDGALDLLVTKVGGPARLLRNVAPHRGHWLMVRRRRPGAGGATPTGPRCRWTRRGGAGRGLVSPDRATCAATTRAPTSAWGTLRDHGSAAGLAGRDRGTLRRRRGGPGRRRAPGTGPVREAGRGAEEVNRNPSWGHGLQTSGRCRARRWLLLALASAVAGLGVLWYFGWRQPPPRPPDIDLAGIDPEVAEALEEARQAVIRKPSSAEAWGTLANRLNAAGFVSPRGPVMSRRSGSTRGARPGPTSCAVILLHGPAPADAIPPLRTAIQRESGNPSPRLRPGGIPVGARGS